MLLDFNKIEWILSLILKNKIKYVLFLSFKYE